jgi:CheY-like chemotaxis protein
MSQEADLINTGEELLLKARRAARRSRERTLDVTGGGEGPPKLVLVVEDDPATREMLGTVLRQQGYAVEEAADGREALARLRGGPRPAGIVLDLMMPRMDGRAFRAEQQRDRDLAGIPVVVCSGAPDAGQEAEELGASACVQKPIHCAELFRALWRHC